VSGPQRSRRELAALAVTAAIEAPLLYLAFAALARWARVTFAQSFLAACLLAAIEAALFGGALVLAPLVSKGVLSLISRLPPPARRAGPDRPVSSN